MLPMKKILVVDDDKASCELLSEILTAHGWEVLTANSPAKALELSEQSAFDLVISDINLESNISGLDLLKKLREKSPVTSNDIIAAFQAIPPAQRGISVKAAFYRYMDKRFPCR